MIPSDNMYGHVEGIHRAGSDKRETDAFEALLCLCRLLSLYYEIVPLTMDGKLVEGKFVITLTNGHWPCHFFAPTRRGVRYSVLGAPHDKVMFYLESAIAACVSDVIRNADMFAHRFEEEWRDRTGREWRDK